MLVPVKRLLPLFGLILAVLWVPVTSHCAWENFSDWQFFQCADDASPASQESDCNDDTCLTVESASYKISETDALLAVPCFHLMAQVSIPEPICKDPSFPVTAALAEISIGWQFSYRTALPPRAPSFVS
jgi:hypothetical protein